ncbi:MAG: TetR/AcrR family transcriptional regulator [Anaerolineaceae bacterium]|nr:TetR/AcrR family transcriptional regulator [Anaerolineaceae bacterium]
METKELILQTAVRLFNQMGTARVSTNRIAEEAGISPGNLYYHFADKAHILREIYEHMISDWDEVYRQIGAGMAPEEALRHFIEANFDLLWHYRFFSRETVALLNADPLLKARHVELSGARFEQQAQLLRKLVDSGQMRFSSAEKLTDTLVIAWIVANQYLVYLESIGHEVEEADFQKGASLVLEVFAPYLAH